MSLLDLIHQIPLLKVLRFELLALNDYMLYMSFVHGITPTYVKAQHCATDVYSLTPKGTGVHCI